MNYIATISSKRLLTIPSNLFKRVKFSKGDKLYIKEEFGELRIKKINTLVKELAGSVLISDHLKKVDYDEAIKSAKRKHFER